MPREHPDRILLFGGTFDPPHRAHVEIPQHVARALDCERIIYIPAALNPLKTEAPPTADHHRLAMLRLALADQPNTEINTIELDRGGPSYFIDTLRALRRTPGSEPDWFFLVGTDQALGFQAWKDWREILALAQPVVALRPPWDRERFREAMQEHTTSENTAFWLDRIIDAPVLDINASDLRRRLAANEDAGVWLPPDVESYIRSHALYRDDSNVP